MFDIRKIVVVLLIAILFSVFVFTTVEAIYPSPEYDSYCGTNSRSYAMPVKESLDCPALNPSQDAIAECDPKGYISYRYDSQGCATEYYCETCDKEYQAAQDSHSRVVFYVAAVLSLIAIFVALSLPSQTKKGNNVHEWIGSGLLLGGAFVLLFGTIQGFSSLDRIARPIVMLLELALVIFLAYKKLK